MIKYDYMAHLSLPTLFIILIVLILVSAFFSGSETSMMAINRYRLRNLKNKKHKAATRVSHLLERTDALISMILLGNNFVNILASSIATIIGIRLFGDTGIAIATGLLTFVILIFAEITPKTIAALKPEKFAFPASFVLVFLLKVLSPLTWFLNLFTKIFLKFFGIHQLKQPQDILNKEEIRAVVNDSQNLTSKTYHQMLLGILDLEKMTVEDIMIPRHEIIGININDNEDKIIHHLSHSQHTRIPVYRDDISECIGFLHVKDIMKPIHENSLSKKKIMTLIHDPLFIPANSLLDEQLKLFQTCKRRTGLVVNEYGDLQGLITLEDILEEIIGNFTTNVAEPTAEIHKQTDGTYLVDCTILIRELNQELQLNLPIYKHAKTLNGLILEKFEDIPEPGTSIKISGIPIEIIATKNNLTSTVRLLLNQKQ